MAKIEADVAATLTELPCTYASLGKGTARVELCGAGDSGGTCETYRHAAVRKKLDAYGGPLSLYTAVITFQNHNGRVPQRTSHITFAHELGHNFGSSPEQRGLLYRELHVTQNVVCLQARR
nr:uncharacterized protein LOC129386961 [Dermacentor andersoni]